MIFLAQLTAGDHSFLMGLAGLICGCLFIYSILRNM